MNLARRMTSGGLFEQCGTTPSGEPLYRRIALPPTKDEAEHSSLEGAIFEYSMTPHDPKPPPSAEQAESIRREFEEVARQYAGAAGSSLQPWTYVDDSGRRVGGFVSSIEPFLPEEHHDR